MDKVTAAMVLTSLSTSPLVRSPPVKVSEGLSNSWKDNNSVGPFTPSSNSSSGGYWSWSAPSDQSNPSTPSPPLSADSFKPFRVPSLGGVGPGPAGPDDPSLDDQDGSSLLFDEPIPRKRKNSMKVMFKCLWKNCGKVLSTAAGIQRHIRTIHLRRNCDSDCSDGEEDFYYTEIKLNTDSVADGLSSLSSASPSVLSPPPPPPPPPPPAPASLPSVGQPSDTQRPPQSADTKEPHASGTTPLSRSAPSALYLIHTDHAYQATAPVLIPSSSSNSASSASTSFTPTNSSSFSISWQSPPVTFTGNTVSPSKSQSFSEQRSQTIAALSSPPRASTSLRVGRFVARGRNAVRCTGWRTATCGAQPAAGKRPARGSPTEQIVPTARLAMPTGSAAFLQRKGEGHHIACIHFVFSSKPLLSVKFWLRPS
ncbi:hypothetical protein LDENG_00269580 [Lucifuga dentata]|nr:hypothetical protein LDENG_00269580 [Lucifuga dentata]